MSKFLVRLDCGKKHTINADVVTIDPHAIRFDTRAEAGKPAVLVAYFPARTVVEVINGDKK